MKRFSVDVLLDLVDRFSGPLKSGPMKQLTALQKQTEITDRSMGRLFTGGGVVAAGLAFAAPLIFSFNAASDLTEALNKNQVVFGQHARQVQQWANTSSTAFGQARVDALSTVGTFGNLFTSMGLNQGRAAGLSMDIVKLGGDLASFSNTSPTDALDALRSGLAGEIEPLRRYGVNLSAAAVAQKAFAMGLTPKVMNATDINPATKALATYQIILEQTKNAQGDYARTSDGSANALRTILGLMKDLRTTVGTQLEPVFRPLILAFRDLLVFVNRLAQANPVLTRVLAVTTLGLSALLTLVGFGIVTVAGLTLAMSQARIGLMLYAGTSNAAAGSQSLLNLALAGTRLRFTQAATGARTFFTSLLGAAQLKLAALQAGGLSGALAVLKVGFMNAARASWAFTASLLTNPVFLLIAALVALGVGFVWAWRKSEDFRAGVLRGLEPIRRSWAGLKDDVAALGQTFAPLGAMFSRVTQAMGLDLTKIKGPLDALGYAFGYFIGFVGTGLAITFGRTIAFLVTGFGGLVQTINGLITAGQGLVSLDFAKMNTGLSQARGGLEQTLLAPLELAGVDTRQYRADLRAANRDGKTIWERIGGWLGVPGVAAAPDSVPFAFGLNTMNRKAQDWGAATRGWIGERFQTGGVAVGNFIGDLTSASTEGKPIWQSLLDKVTAPFSLPGVNRRKNFVPSLEGAAAAGKTLWETVKEQFPGFALPALNRARNFVSSLTGAETAGGDAWGRIKGLLSGFALPSLNRQASFVPSLAGAETAGGDAWANIKKLFPAFNLPWIKHANFKESLTKADAAGDDAWSNIKKLFPAFSLPWIKNNDHFKPSLRDAQSGGKTIWGRISSILNAVISMPGVDWSAVQTTLTEMLGHITGFGPQLLSAGEGLIGNLIEGIKGKLAELTAVFDNIKLPFSIPGIGRADEAPGGTGVKAATQANPTANLTGIANRTATPAAMRTPAATVLPGGAAGPQLLTPDFYRSLGTLDPASELGKMLAVGFAGSILNNQDVARYAARSMATGTIDEVRQKLQIRSPSRVFAGLGAFIPQGLGQGILGQRGAVTRAMQTLAAAAVAVPITPALGVAEVPNLAGPPPLTRPAVAAPGEAQTRTASGQTAPGGAVHKTYSFAGANFNLDMSEIRGKEDFMGKLEELFQWFGDDE